MKTAPAGDIASRLEVPAAGAKRPGTALTAASLAHSTSLASVQRVSGARRFRKKWLRASASLSGGTPPLTVDLQYSSAWAIRSRSASESSNPVAEDIRAMSPQILRGSVPRAESTSRRNEAKGGGGSDPRPVGEERGLWSRNQTPADTRTRRSKWSQNMSRPVYTSHWAFLHTPQPNAPASWWLA